MELDWTDEQLEEAGLDKQKVLSIARRLAKISTEMREIGLSVYGCNNRGFLVHHSRPTHPDGSTGDTSAFIVDLGRGFDGGDL